MNISLSVTHLSFIHSLQFRMEATIRSFWLTYSVIYSTNEWTDATDALVGKPEGFVTAARLVTLLLLRSVVVHVLQRLYNRRKRTLWHASRQASSPRQVW